MNVVRFRRLAIAVLVYTLAVILWGAFVRATGSGAGCGSHWPACNGEVIPRAPTVATIIEFTHRFTSGLALLAVLVLGFAAFKTFPKGHSARHGAVMSIVFMLTEALVGAGIVLLEYVAQDERIGRAAWMGVHLINTFLLLAALTLTVVRADHPGKLVLRGQGRVGAAIGASFLGMLLLGVTGAIAALGDTLFPSLTLAQGMAQDLSPAAHWFERLRVLHPVSAVLVGVLVTLTAMLVARLRPSPRVRTWAGVVRAIFGIQFAIGIINLALLAPVAMQLVHLLFADFLWMAFVVLASAALAEGAEHGVSGVPAVERSREAA